MINRRAWLLLALSTVACSHAAGHNEAAKPITVVALPKANPEAAAEFDQGVAVMKLGRKHYKEARGTSRRPRSSTASSSRPGTIWASSRRRSATTTRPWRTSRRRSTSSPARGRQSWPTAEGLRRAHRPQKAAKVYAKWLGADPKDAEVRARYGQVLREAGDLDGALEQAREILAQGGSSQENVAQTSLLITPWVSPTIKWASWILRKPPSARPLTWTRRARSFGTTWASSLSIEVVTRRHS